jgi:hypothetical protein
VTHQAPICRPGIDMQIPNDDQKKIYQRGTQAASH